MLERRSEVDHATADRFTKRVIIWTVCIIAIMLSSTMCYLAVLAAGIPDQVDRLATLLIGALVGSLVKTGVDAVLPSDTPRGTTADPMKTEVVNKPADAIPVAETTTADAPADEPVDLDDDGGEDLTADDTGQVKP